MTRQRLNKVNVICFTDPDRGIENPLILMPFAVILGTDSVGKIQFNNSLVIDAVPEKKRVNIYLLSPLFFNGNEY